MGTMSNCTGQSRHLQHTRCLGAVDGQVSNAPIQTPLLAYNSTQKAKAYPKYQTQSLSNERVTTVSQDRPSKWL